MERFIRRCRKNLGLIISAFGLGLIISVIAPIWAWVLFVGGAIVAAGTFYFKKK